MVSAGGLISEQLKGVLCERLPQNVYKLWIDPLSFEWDGEELVVGAPNTLLLDEVNQRHLDDIRTALNEAGHPEASVRCLLRPRTLEPQTVLPRESTPAASSLEPPSPAGSEDPLSRFTFDEFVVGPDNQMAYASCQAVAREPGGQFNPLFLYGSTGLGKTHLLQAVLRAIHLEHPHLKVLSTNCETFTNEFIEAIKHHTLDAFRSRHRTVDVLIVDDIQFLADKGSTQEEFFHTFNDLISSDRQVIVSSDSAPADLIRFEDRLISRFSSGLVTSIDKPLYETRLAILRQKAGGLDIELPGSVLQELASLPIDNIRELNGALTTLAAHIRFNGASVDSALIEKLFPHLKPSSTIAKRIDWNDVVSLVTEHYGVRLQDLQSKKRHKPLITPRHLAMYLLRSLTDHSLEEIGAFFGGRDHSTVQHAQGKIESRRKTEADLDALIRDFETRLTGERSS